ncbi:acyl-CoA dehydrogenase [Fluviispira multicolorata]|uniref:Acyl-CoA dehydrogenase n=1 Tax=Fluviispira multicolorata TaxID=2654512 RepID=A0A833JF42_9BACT|nr:acyl-CoA dehydrogenase [Fluviispira multicolorata]KAB8033228.1 acyl-CoA dehydrogenase [Fluviispira multicolorata]
MAANSSFMVDRREIEFVLFEYLQIQKLFDIPHYSDHSIESVGEMLTSAISLCNQHLGPLNKVGDRVGCVHNKETKEVTTPKGTKETYKQFVDNGFLTLSDTEEAGGIQAPSVVAAVFMELFSSANQAFTMYPGLTKSASHVLYHFGEEWMKKTCVPKIASGTWTGTMCLTEPSAGSAVGDLKSTAKRNKDGSFKIKGVKQWISGGENDFAENILHLVLARIEDAPQGIEGVSLFLVPKKRFDKITGKITGKNDLYCISLEEKMGIHGNSTCLMGFGDKDDCEGFLIGKENHGIHYMFLMMNEARIGVGLQGLAQASVAFLNAEAYAKERIQGVDITSKKDAKNPPRIAIVNHPDVKRMLLRQRSIVEGIRALSYTTALMHDESEHSPDKENKKKCQGFLELLTPIMKAWATDMGFASIVQSIQTYGGYGFTKDYPVEQLLRDSKIASIYEGTNGIQALDLVGRKMRMEEGAIFMGWLERHTDFIEKYKEHKTIGGEAALLEEYIAGLAEAAMHMGEVAKKGDRKAAIVNAYPFLMALGHTIIAGLLLEQAVIASEKLSGKLSATDKRFYSNKIKTAKFFAHHVLPEAKSYLANVTSADNSCLEFEF